jgi:hypothetical protein
MKISLLTGGLALVLAAAASVASADATRTINETRALDGNAALSVRCPAGSITVQAWEQTGIAISGSLRDDSADLVITGDASKLQVEVKNRQGEQKEYWNGDGSNLVLKVPAGVTLTLDGTSADLIVQGVKGAVTARSVSGDVRLNIGSTNVVAQSVSGDLDVNAPAATLLKLSTVSGDATVQNGSGKLVAESVSGDLHILGGYYGAIDAQSVSGDVDIAAKTSPQAWIKAETMSGDVHYAAPGNLSADVTLETFSGDAHSAFTGTIAAKDSRRTTMRVGDGQGRISLTSFSGDVKLDKR